MRNSYAHIHSQYMESTMGHNTFFLRFFSDCECESGTCSGSMQLVQNVHAAEPEQVTQLKSSVHCTALTTRVSIGIV